MAPLLSNWSWQQIAQAYKKISRNLITLHNLHSRINFPQPTMDFEDEVNSYLMRFWRAVTLADQRLEVLDIEIARRNKLIGVI